MKVGYRLSPNEELQLLQAERERRRKLRLVQVREQAKLNAAHVRNAVKEEKSKQLNKVAEQLKVELEKERQKRMKQLSELCVKTASGVGEAHREAFAEETHPKHRMRVLRQKSDVTVANERHKMALQQMKEEREAREREASKLTVLRQTALETERARSAIIVALPRPSPDPIDSLGIDKPHTMKAVRRTDLDAFSSTHYHFPERCVIEKAEPTEQGNAKVAAEEESERMNEAKESKKSAEDERREKARLRHNHAVHKELIKQDYSKMMLELSDLQRADMHRRQKVVAKIPKQIFEPPHRHLEGKEEEQRDMEQAFENMYMAATDYMGDMSMILDPHPPPPTPSTTSSLDVTADVEEEGQQGNEVRHTETISDTHSAPSTGPSQDTTSLGNGQVLRRLLVDSGKPPGGALKNLLSKIKGQRDEWVQRSASSTETDPSVRSSDQESTAPSSVLSTHPDTNTLSSGIISNGSTSSRLPSTTDVTEESVTPSTVTTLETGTIMSSGVSEDRPSTIAESCSSEQTRESYESEPLTLLHPLEAAAELRSQPMRRQRMSASLTAERQRQAEMAADSMQLKRDTDQQRRDWELQKSLLQQRLNEIESRRRALASQLVAASTLSVPMPPTSASSVASSMTTDPSSLAMEPVVMAMPERKSWDAAGSIQRQSERQRPINLPVVVSASNMFPVIPDGGPAVIQNDHDTTAQTELRCRAADIGDRKKLLLEEARQRLHDRAQRLFQEASTLLKVPAMTVPQGPVGSDGWPAGFERMSELGQFHDVEISGTTVEQTLSSEASLSPNYVRIPDTVAQEIPHLRRYYPSVESGRGFNDAVNRVPLSVCGSVEDRHVGFSQVLSNFDQCQATLETQLRQIQRETHNAAEKYQDAVHESDARSPEMEREDEFNADDRDRLLQYIERRHLSELDSDVDSTMRDSSVASDLAEPIALYQSRPPPAFHRQWPSTPHELSVIIEADTPASVEQQRTISTDKPTGRDVAPSQSGYQLRQMDSAIFSMTSADTPRSGDTRDDVLQKRDPTRKQRPLHPVYQTDSAVFSTTSGDTYQSGSMQRSDRCDSGVFGRTTGNELRTGDQQPPLQHISQTASILLPSNVQTDGKPFLATLESFYEGPPSDDNEDNDDVDVYKPHPEGITVDSLNSLTSDTSRSTATDSYLQWKSPAIAPLVLGERRTQYTASPSGESPNFGDISESSTTPTHNIMTRQLPLSSTPAGGRSVPMMRGHGDALPSFPSSPCDADDEPINHDNERRSVSFQTTVASANDGETNWSAFLSSKLKEMAAERFSRNEGNIADPGASFLSTRFMPQPIGRDTGGVHKLSTNETAGIEPIRFGSPLSLKLKEMAAERLSTRFTAQPIGSDMVGVQKLPTNATANVEPIRFGSQLHGESANNETVASSQPTLPTGGAPLQEESQERSECVASASDASTTNPTDLSEYTISGESDSLSQNQAPVLKSPPMCDLTQYSIKSDSSDEQRSHAQMNPDDVREDTEPASQGIIFGCPMTDQGVLSSEAMPPPLSVKQAAFTPKLPPLSTEGISSAIEAPPAGYWLDPTTRLPDDSSTDSTAHESSERCLELTQERFFEALAADSTGITHEPAEDSTGITDEPDLTLVSLNSTVAGQATDNPSVATPTSEENISSSLMSFIQHEQSVGSVSPQGGATVHARPYEDSTVPDSRAGAVMSGRYRDVSDSVGMTSRAGEGTDVFQPLGGEPGSGSDYGNDNDGIVSFPVVHAEGYSSDSSCAGLSLADVFAKRRRRFIEASQKRKAESHTKAKARLEATQRAAPIRFQKQPKAEARKKATGSHSPTRKVTVAKTGSGTMKPVKRKPKAVTHAKPPSKPTKRPEPNVRSQHVTAVAGPKRSIPTTGKGVTPQSAGPSVAKDLAPSTNARHGSKPSFAGSSSGKTQQKQLGKMLASWKRNRSGT